MCWLPDVRFWQILLQKWAAAGGGSAISYERGFDPPSYATSTLRAAQSLSGWRSRDQRCEPSQILSDGGQNKLVLRASWAGQSKPAELQDGLEVRKPHLDLLALAPRSLKIVGANERSGDVVAVRVFGYWTAPPEKRAILRAASIVIIAYTFGVFVILLCF